MSEPNIKTIAFDLPKKNMLLKGFSFAKAPEYFNIEEKSFYIENIKRLLKEKDAVLVSHYYVDPDLQDLAKETNGCVSDSLEMAKFSHNHKAKTVIVCGVKFMGETAKILNPEKTILMPELEANCSLDLGCPPADFNKFCDENPDRVVVVYANTSAAVKARADWMVTSSIALDVVAHLHKLGKKILWAPDRHLGSYIQSVTKADMLLWNGSCIVHDEFKSYELEELKKLHPNAPVLVHPESPASVVALADVVGSTTQILNAATSMPNKTFIVATDAGLFHALKKNNPDKTFIVAPTAGNSATCKSCAMCPWMAMNNLKNLYELLLKYDPNNNGSNKNEILVDENIAILAKKSITNMLNFAANKDLTKAVVNAPGNVDGIGPA